MEFILLSAAIGELAQTSDPPAKAVLLDLEMTYELDVPSTDALAELKEELEGAGVDLLLTRVHGDVRDMLDRSGVTEKIGPENIYPSIIEGVFAYLRETKEVAEYARGIADNLGDLIQIVDLAAEQAEGEDRIRLQTIRERLQAVSEAIGPESY